ncbi:MAG: hypothetical protein E3J72_16445 [Planctomycetota bacterium]|nr:MAG: hypothetical protein E3J72_16445 [Planctomycetota bacterium]
MVKNIIMVFVLIFIIFYAIQIAAFHSLEKLGSKNMGGQGLEGLEVRIMLGAKPSDKYIPGLGGARLVMSGPCRVEVAYKDQTEWKTIKEQKDADLESVVVHSDAQKLYVYVMIKGAKELFELDINPKE